MWECDGGGGWWKRSVVTRRPPLSLQAVVWCYEFVCVCVVVLVSGVALAFVAVDRRCGVGGALSPRPHHGENGWCGWRVAPGVDVPCVAVFTVGAAP